MQPETRLSWEYAQLLVNREPSPSPDFWPISMQLFTGDGQTVPVDGDNPVVALNGLGRDGWELVGPPEVLSVVASHIDSGGQARDRAYWVERRFWLKRTVQS
jgi:hypothetical protein